MWVMAKTYAEKMAELAALRERVIALQTAVVSSAVLIGKLEAQVAAERKRSDTAVDRLLNEKGLPAVTPPRPMAEQLADISSMFDETDVEAEAVRKRIEAEGVEAVLLSGVA